MTLKGCFPVLCTPFGPDGQINEADFADLVEFVIATGADGCVFPGMASEVETLRDDERDAMVARLGHALAERIPFITGASAAAPDASLHHIAQGARAGAVAAMIMAPAHLGDDVAAHIAHFQQIAAASDLPLMLQNAPRPNGAGLAPEAVAAIANAVPAIVWIKEETQPCGQHLTRIRAAASGHVLGVFGGAGGRSITDELARGALGTLPASELTDLHVRLVRAWDRGDQAEARRLFMLTLPLLSFQAVFRVHMTKHVLRRRGVLRHVHIRAAGPRPDADDLRELDTLLDLLAPEFTQYPVLQPMDAQ